MQGIPVKLPRIFPEAPLTFYWLLGKQTISLLFRTAFLDVHVTVVTINIFNVSIAENIFYKSKGLQSSFWVSGIAGLNDNTQNVSYKRSSAQKSDCAVHRKYQYRDATVILFVDYRTGQEIRGTPCYPVDCSSSRPNGICTMEWDPVCDLQGNRYANPCEMTNYACSWVAFALQWPMIVDAFQIIGKSTFVQQLLQANDKRSSKLRITGLCEGNPPATSRFPSQRTIRISGIDFPISSKFPDIGKSIPDDPKIISQGWADRR